VASGPDVTPSVWDSTGSSGTGGLVLTIMIVILYLIDDLFNPGMSDMANIPRLLVHDHRDNVGVVVVEDLAPGTGVLGVITEDNTELHTVVLQPVPIGHKIALKDLAIGDTVIKYGHDIGKVIAPIRAGEHVHVHNLKTKRW
jgi:(2R)-sulfolactate sulfo-lyase subunit alpha